MGVPIVHVTISEQIPAILNRIITVDYWVHLVKTVRWLHISIAKESKEAS
jgi:hypothetical protein